MEFLIAVRPDAPDRFVAEVVGLPKHRAVAATEDEAVSLVRSSLTEWLALAKIVRVEIPGPERDNPWLEWAGWLADDPHFHEYIAEIERSRSEDSPP